MPSSAYNGPVSLEISGPKSKRPHYDRLKQIQGRCTPGAGSIVSRNWSHPPKKALLESRQKENKEEEIPQWVGGGGIERGLGWNQKDDLEAKLLPR